MVSMAVASASTGIDGAAALAAAKVTKVGGTMSKELRQSGEDIFMQQPDGSWLVQAPPKAWSWRKEPEVYQLKNNEDKEKFIKHITNKTISENFLPLYAMVVILILQVDIQAYRISKEMIIGTPVYLVIFVSIFLYLLPLDRQLGFRRWLARAGRRVKQEDIPSSFPIRDFAGWHAAWVAYHSPITRTLRVASRVLAIIIMGLFAAWLILACAPWAEAARASLNLVVPDHYCPGWIQALF